MLFGFSGLPSSKNEVRRNCVRPLNVAPSNTAFSVCALHEALETLTQIDPRRAKVIELRFFGGLSVDETAEVLGVSSQTVMRDWRLARAWLARELRGDESRAT